MRESLIEDLKNLGLNIYEAKVYLALIERSSLDTAEIAQISGVPRARTYDILDNLVRRGLASLKPGKNKKYGALDIETFRQRLIAENREASIERELKIEETSLKLKKKLEKLYSPENLPSDPLQYIEIIRNPARIHQKFLQLLHESKKEILIFTKPPYAGNVDQKSEQIQLQEQLMQRGVRIKSICEIPSDPQERRWWLKRIENASPYGEETRVIKELPMKLAVFDELTVIYTLEDPILHTTSVTTMVTEHRSLAKSLKMLFDNIWEKALDYHSLEVEGGD